MKITFLALGLSLFSLGNVFAATITNTDSENHVLLVTEGGSKTQIIVSAGESASFCPSGCFVTMPSGDRETLIGDEKIEIIDRNAVIK